MIVHSLFPTTFSNNWYITCYLLFYALHPFLNRAIGGLDQRGLLRCAGALVFLYVVCNFLVSGLFFRSDLILWVAIYFAMAYMKFYTPESADSVRLNVALAAAGLVGLYGMVALTNLVGLRFDILQNRLLKWNSNCNPFAILFSIGLLNVARNFEFRSALVNGISGLSLLVYVIHENILLRNYYRPLLWQWVYESFGYDHVLVWALVFSAGIFVFGLVAAALYRATLQRLTVHAVPGMYGWLVARCGRIEDAVMKLR